VEVNAADYPEFPKDTVTGRADRRSPVTARAQQWAAGRYAAENAFQRATASAEAGIGCRVYRQLELVASRRGMPDFDRNADFAGFERTPGQ